MSLLGVPTTSHSARHAVCTRNGRDAPRERAVNVQIGDVHDVGVDVRTPALRVAVNDEDLVDLESLELLVGQEADVGGWGEQ